MYACTWVCDSYVCAHAYKSICVWYICIYEHVVCVHSLCTCVLGFTYVNVLIVCCGCTCDACVCTHVECVYVIHVCTHTTCVVWFLWQYRRNPHTLLCVLFPPLLQTRRAGVSWGSAGLRGVKGSRVRHQYHVRDWTGSLRGTGHPPHRGKPFCPLWQLLCPEGSCMSLWWPHVPALLTGVWRKGVKLLSGWRGWQTKPPPYWRCSQRLSGLCLIEILV